MLKIKELKPSGFAVAFALAFLLQYGIEHATYLLRDAVMSGSVMMTATVLNGISTAAGYAVTSLEVLILAAAAFVTLTLYLECGTRVALMSGAIITLCRLCYLIPHYYMTLFSLGFDTAEALLFLVPLSIFLMAIYYGEMALAVLLAMLPSAKRSRLDTGDGRTVLADSYCDTDILDIGKPITASVALIALLSVSVPFISSVIDAVTLLVERGPAFSLSDAFIIIFDLAFLVILFVLSHLICFAIKKTIVGRCAEEDSPASENTGRTEQAANTTDGIESVSGPDPQPTLTPYNDNNSTED